MRPDSHFSYDLGPALARLAWAARLLLTTAFILLVVGIFLRTGSRSQRAHPAAHQQHHAQNVDYAASTRYVSLDAAIRLTPTDSTMCIRLTCHHAPTFRRLVDHEPVAPTPPPRVLSAAASTVLAAPAPVAPSPPVPAPTRAALPVAAAPVLAPAPSSSSSAAVFAEWTRVAVCEEGGWIGYAGPAYPDSLGISAQNWAVYGGGASLAPWAQIAVAQRLLAAAGMAGWVPDQTGCAAW